MHIKIVFAILLLGACTSNTKPTVASVSIRPTIAAPSVKSNPTQAATKSKETPKDNNASTGPLRILTKEQVEAASKAAQKRLPTADREAADKCRSSPSGDPATLVASAECYRQAGRIGLAIMLWKRLVQRHPTAAEVKVALSNLGSAWEKTGRFVDAAQSYVDYARKYPSAPDSSDQLVRGMCIYFQLGSERELERVVYYLRRKPGFKTTGNEIALCDKVRPIQPPSVVSRGPLTCDRVAKDLSPLRDSLSGAVRRSFAKACKALNFTPDTLRCLDKAGNDLEVNACLEKAQSFVEGVRVFCGARTHLKSSLKGRDTVQTAVTIANYLEANIVHPRIIRAFGELADKRPADKVKIFEKLVNDSGLKRCDYLESW